MYNFNKLEEELDQLLNELTFHGSPCTKDCSGHSAGYNWEKRKALNIRQNTHSNSFNNGTEIATNMRRLGRINAIGSGIRGAGGRFVKFQKTKESQLDEIIDLTEYHNKIYEAFETTILKFLKELPSTIVLQKHTKLKQRLVIDYIDVLKNIIKEKLFKVLPDVDVIKFITFKSKRTNAAVDKSILFFSTNILTDFIIPIANELEKTANKSISENGIVLNLNIDANILLKTVQQDIQHWSSNTAHEYTHVLQNVIQLKQGKEPSYKSYFHNGEIEGIEQLITQFGKEKANLIYRASPQEIAAFANGLTNTIITHLTHGVDITQLSNKQINYFINKFKETLSIIMKYTKDSNVATYIDFNVKDNKKFYKIFKRFLKLTYMGTMKYIEKLQASSTLTESIQNLDLDKAYEIFKQSYEQETGASWSKDKFLNRAYDWTFYGDETGFIAVRFQRSGLAKLVGAAGNPRGILKGIKELQAENKPVWGMASANIAAQLEKLGFIRPPAKMLKVIAKIIPKSVFGGVDYTVNTDGSLTFNYNDVGAATKYFVANKLYFISILDQIKSGNHIPIPTFTKVMIAGWIKKILGM